MSTHLIENWGIMNECDRQRRKAFSSSWKDLRGEMLTVVTDLGIQRLIGRMGGCGGIPMNQHLQTMQDLLHTAGVCLGKIRVVNVPAWLEEGLRMPHPKLSCCWQLRAVGEEESGGCFCCCLVVCFREVC